MNLEAWNSEFSALEFKTLSPYAKQHHKRRRSVKFRGAHDILPEKLAKYPNFFKDIRPKS